MKTFVIAEAGSNHNGIYEQAISLIDVAKESGATAVKFQTAKSDMLYAKNTPMIAGVEDVRGLIKKIEIPRHWQPELKKYCDKIGIEFMSTPFDEQAVQQLVDIGVKRIKIAGFESSDFRFVDMVSSTKLPLIVSIGIGFPMSRIKELTNIFVKNNNEVTFLHANNAYPTPMSDINLKRMIQIREITGNINCGLSDHTISTLTPALAVSMGAVAIEKHFTLSRKLSGPDHGFALEPNELKEMIVNIKEAEKAISFVSDDLTPSEKMFIKAKRSMVAIVDLKPGDIITTENTTTMRPLLEDSIPAEDYYKYLGRVITKDIQAFNTISIKSVE